MPERLPRLRPDQLDADQRALYAEIAGGPRSAGPALFALTGPDGALNGPFNAMLFAPEVGHALQGLGAAIRYGTQLPPRVRELAILIVAAHWDSAFERCAHEAIGRHAGLTEAELTAVRRGEPLELADPVERAAVALARSLVGSADLDDEQYAAAVSAVGARGVVEVSTLVGYYAALALQLRIFRVEAPAGA